MTTVMNTGRNVFFDNLRSLMVLLVLVFHSGASYSSAVEFWPFHDRNFSGIIDIFMFLCDVFMMSVLFFIAGYFALPNMQKKGAWSFVKGKLKRLGIPWLIITIIVLPLIDFFHYYRLQSAQLLPATGLFEYWILCMKKIVEFKTGWIDMSAYWNMTENFYQRYMWFISLLLAMFIAHALLNKLMSCLTKKSITESKQSDKKNSIYKSMAVTSGIMILLFGIVRLAIYPEFMGSGWFSLGNILQFQLGKLVLYAGFFSLGIYAFSRKWFTGNAGFGKAWIWAIICFCLFGFNMLVLKNLKSPETAVFGYKIAFSVLYPLWTLSFLGFFVSLAYKFWNRQTKMNSNLTENSYNMYLVHYIIPFILPVFLAKLNINVLIKFGIVSIVTIIFSYIFSKYIMMPVSRLSFKE